MYRAAHRVGLVTLSAATVLLSACGGGAQIASLVQEKKPAEEMYAALAKSLDDAAVVEIAALEGEPPVPTPKSAQAWVKFGGNPNALDATFGGDGTTVAVRQLAAGISYVKTDNSDKWMEVKAASKEGKNLLPLVELASSIADPLATLDLVAKTATEDGFKDVGTVTLDGAAVTHWQAVQPAGTQRAEWLKDLPPDSKFDPKAPDTVEVWLDDKGFPRRIGQSHQGVLVGFALKPSTVGSHFAKPASSSIMKPQS
jgi:hypothetical protein